MSNIKYDEYKELVDKHLLDFLPEIDPKSETIYDAMSYSLKAGGKRLRPVLVLAACDFCGGDVKSALPYALAIEYIHTYSLIHDDLPCVDNDDLRRGVPTNHVVFGEAMATLAGDGLLNSAFEAMFKDMLLDFDNEKVLKCKVRAASTICKVAGCRGMIAGQVADIEAENTVCSKEMLDYIHTNKTGAMIVGAIQAGAHIGNVNEKDLRALTEYAENLGLAFQICDDILDVVGTTEELGKNVGGAHIGNVNEKDLRALTEYAENLGLAFQICDDILDVVGTTEELGKNVGHDEETNKSTYPALYGLEKSEERFKELNQKAIEALKDYGEEADFFRFLVKKLENRRK